MDSKDIELKSALDEIFGDDIIELNEDIPTAVEKELTNEELFENTSTLVFNQNDIIEDEKNLNLNQNNVIIDFVIPDIPVQTKDESADNLNFDSNENSAPLSDVKNDDSEDTAIDYNNDSKEELKDNQEDIKDEKKSNIPIWKVIIISTLVILLTIVSVYFITDYNSNKEKVINCSYLFDDKNYKITDEYKITYKNKKTTYVEGVYTYTSKTNEYDEQIKYIKEDKLPAIINSNGMKGFTYTYENTDDSIRISSYLDYTIMDEKEIDKIDQNAKPISYFRINLKENSKNLIDLFEKQGYKCITSK